MNIKRLKDKIELLKGKKIHLKINGSRNQTEEFECIIIETYNYIFIVNVIEKNIKKCFSYSDVLINHIEIIN